MPLRPAALATTMVVASLASGVASLWRGYWGDVGFDGTLSDLPDALLLWVMVTLTPVSLITAFLFVPIVTVLELLGRRDFLSFVCAGSVSPILPLLAVSLLDGIVLNVDAIAVFALPGAIAGLCWWWMAIEGGAPNPHVSDRNYLHG